MDIALPTDATIVFIGRVYTPWADQLTCPRQGRQDAPTCRIQFTSRGLRRCAFTPLAPRQPGDDQVGDPE